MKRYALLIISVLIAGSGFAQVEYLPTKEDLGKVIKSKTYVVLDESPISDFNFEIKEVMARVWTLNKFEFIKSSEFEKLSSNENYSFLYTSLVSFEKDKTESRYLFLHYSLGGPNLTIDDLRDVCSVPLAYFGTDPENYIYKLGTIVKFIQNHVNLIYEKPELISNNIFKFYNDNIGDVHTKTLYLVQDELSPEISTPARIKAIYPYKFKIVTREEIKQAIDDADENIVFLHKVGPEGKRTEARCYNILIGAADAKFYYFDYHMISDKKPDGLLESDLKKLAK
ncbi:MAG: hypothetical protein H6538_02565 [Bacteroidales bacterium]|nr:hypothetical protein [Bacteroidales bacterium]MCB8999256.1 hypothetical protein [Bacteroidales bacterium]MCB9013076.1 hypothetical protein [Bacteroidales bacterium]